MKKAAAINTKAFQISIDQSQWKCDNDEPLHSIILFVGEKEFEWHKQKSSFCILTASTPKRQPKVIQMWNGQNWDTWCFHMLPHGSSPMWSVMAIAPCLGGAMVQFSGGPFLCSKTLRGPPDQTEWIRKTVIPCFWGPWRVVVMRNKKVKKCKQTADSEAKNHFVEVHFGGILNPLPRMNFSF